MRSLLLAATLALSGCSLLGGDAARATINDGRATWEAAGIDDYTLLQRSICFCYGPFLARLTVRDGVLVEAVDFETGRALSVNERRRFATIDELFARIEEASGREGAVVTAVYDAQYGFPVEVNADPVPSAADEEFGYEISSFRPLPD